MTRNADRVAVWDLPLRLFHWALAVAVTVSFVAVEFLDDIDLHVRSGQVILGLLVFRLLWGVVGSSTAQFHRFVRGPASVLAAVKGQAQTALGHSALGALSVVAMLTSLSVQVLTGLSSDDEIFTTGPLVKYLSSDQVSWANRIHDWNSKVLLALIALHLLAILYYWLMRKRNLVAPMITGSMPATDALKQASAKVRLKSFWQGVAVAAIGGITAWAVFQL